MPQDLDILTNTIDKALAHLPLSIVFIISDCVFPPFEEHKKYDDVKFEYVCMRFNDDIITPSEICRRNEEMRLADALRRRARQLHRDFEIMDIEDIIAFSNCM